MHDISKHYTKEKRESDNCKYCWIYFLVSWHTISIDNFLKRPCKIISFDKGRSLENIFIECFNLMNLRSFNIPSRSNIIYLLFEYTFQFCRTPKQAHENFLTVFKFIKFNVYGLFLQYEPSVYLYQWIVASLHSVDAYQVFFKLLPSFADKNSRIILLNFKTGKLSVNFVLRNFETTLRIMMKPILTLYQKHLNISFGSFLS